MPDNNSVHSYSYNGDKDSNSSTPDPAVVEATSQKSPNKFPKRLISLSLFVLVLFALLTVVTFKVSGKAHLEDSILGGLRNEYTEKCYVLQDKAALARFQLKKSVNDFRRRARVLVFGERSSEVTGGKPAEGVIDVSQSGGSKEDQKVKGAVLGDDDKPIYFQYLPVPSVSNFSTSAQTASATVSYPVETPPGPGGIKPSVGLSYSSARVDNLLQLVNTSKKHHFVRQAGPVGLGWGISGGSYGISIDTHGQVAGEEHDKWTFHLNGPMGSAELIKVDSNGNKIKRGNRSAWENGQWATDPELFVKILEGPSGDNKYDKFSKNSRWRIKTADGTEYIFQGVARSYVHLWYLPNSGCAGGADWRGSERITGWNLKKVRNPLGSEVNYDYERFKGRVFVTSNTDGCSGGGDYVGRTAVKKISYGSNEIIFNYNQKREDWRLVKETDFEEEDGQYVFENNSSLGHHKNINAYAAASDKALSDVLVKTNGKLVRKYKLNYYDDFNKQDRRVFERDVRGVSIVGDAFAADCDGDWECGKTCSDGCTRECLPDEDCEEQGTQLCRCVDPSAPAPAPSCSDRCEDAFGSEWSGWCVGFGECQNNAFQKRAGRGTDYGCQPIGQDTPECCCARDVPENYMVYGVYNLNDDLRSYHLHLRSIQEFGRDGSTSLPAQTFTYQKIPYRQWWDDGSTVVDRDALNSVYIKTADNGYGGRVTYSFENLQQPVQVCYGDGTCKVDSKNSNVKRDGDEIAFSLQRAKLRMTKTEDGVDDWWENHYIYPDNDLGGLGYMKEDPKQYEYLGMHYVEQVAGAKGADISRGFSYDPGKVESISKTFFSRLAKGPGCIRKSPAAGLAIKSWTMDETGKVLSETLKHYKFNVGNTWAAQCENYKPGQIPLLMSTVSAVVNADEGAGLSNSESLYRDYCSSHNCAKTSSRTFYDWDFSKTPMWNRKHGNFAAATKKINYGDDSRGDDNSTQCTHYARQISGDNWILRKPLATWVQDGSGGDCPLDINAGPTKYQFKQFYYDGRNSVPGSLPASNPKGLVTKTEVTETDSGEKMVSFKEYDQYGNVTKQTDPNGNSSYTRYYPGGIFPKETENALGHKAATDYDFVLGVPTKVTGPNGATTRYAYDALGRLRKVAKPGDSLSDPTSRFEYFINNSSKKAPLAVHKIVKVTGAGETLESYDFYNGIGQKFQTQVLEPDGRALTNTSEVNSVGKTVISYLPFKHSNFGMAVDAPADTANSRTEYDIKGRAFRSVTPDGRVTRKIFREADFLSASVDSENRVVVNKQEGRIGKTINCREKNGQLCSESQGLVTTTYQDVLGNTVKVVDSAAMVLTETAFDTLGRKEWVEDADLGRYEYDYDKNGNLTWQKDPLGNEITFGYDALNRAKWKKFNGDVKVSYSYDNCKNGKGRKCATEDDYQKTTYSYDKRGRLEEVSKSFGGKELAGLFGRTPYTTRYQYDNMGRRTALTYSGTTAFGEEKVSFDYEGPYFKKAEGDDVYVSDVDYNIFGQVERRVLGNAVEESFEYHDLNQRLERIGVSGEDDILDLAYDGYSPAGNITSIDDKLYDTSDELSMDQDFTYDEFYRLTGASGAYNAEYRYDDLDRMTFKQEGRNEHQFTFNKAFPYHGVKEVNGAAISYDSKGEILSYNIAGLERELEWDHSIGKPVKITVRPPDGETITVNFYYDGGGNRLAKKIDGSNYTLYVNPRLEKVAVSGDVMWRKNYMAGGKFVAVRNIGGGSTEMNTDVNGDGRTDAQDAEQVLADYKNEEPDNPLTDVNGDGVVNGMDLALIIMSMVD